MAINSNRKGKRVERAAAKFIESIDFSFEARRSQQYAGNPEVVGSEDLKTNVGHTHAEVKGGYNNVETHHKRVLDWIEQVERDRSGDRPWFILWKKDYREWRVIYKREGIIVITINEEESRKAIRELHEGGPIVTHVSQ